MVGVASVEGGSIKREIGGSMVGISFMDLSFFLFCPLMQLFEYFPFYFPV